MFLKNAITFLLLGSVVYGFAAEPERSAIQILTYRQEPDWSAPWRFDAVQRAGGSGFVIKGKRIRWPRIENADHIMVAASVRPLIDALRIAYVELIEWLVAEYGFEKMEAFQVASQIGEVRVANVVDPNYTVVAKFPKRFLPPRRSGG